MKLLMARIFLFSFLGVMSGTVQAQASGKNSPVDTTVSFKVYGVCEQCKHRIEEALHIKGVQKADWNIDSKIATISFNPARISLQKLHDHIAAAGHDTQLEKAKDAVYKALPDCCHYREIKSMEDGSVENNIADDTATFKALPDTGLSRSMPTIKGVVLEEDVKGSFAPLTGATIQWLGSTIGTASDSTGQFSIAAVANSKRLIVSYAGYQPDTVSIVPATRPKIILGRGKQLQEVKVTSGRAATYINSYDPFRTAVMTKNELFKAACCNLSESFETNPSVDVSYSDAVTGSKQIQLLGLSGNYTQLTVENLPGPRGLATPLGLNFIPGPWIESIQLIKGTGSVVNGFESIAGQINIELKKPQTSERLYANIYQNDFGKTDININLAQKINNKWSTALLVHDNFLRNKTDFNKDGFIDVPTGNLFSALNRWSYEDNKGFITQVGVKWLEDSKMGGQTAFNPSTDKFTNHYYGLSIQTKRVEAFSKIGYVFPQKKYKSIGLQIAAFHHNQDSYFGSTTYNGTQQNIYSNLIYQSIIGNAKHKFRTGLSFVYDKYNEVFKQALYNRKEIVPGGFFEYTYSPSAKLDIVAGLRQDHNNIYGWFTTPRLNMRYEPLKGTTIRLSAGRGQRTANIFAENNSVFISSRQINILNPVAGKAYGLNPEIAWNKGITVDQKFKLFNHNSTFSIEYFRNDFTDQVVVDLENPAAVNFYNLQGRSFSNSFQTEVSVEPISKLIVRLAYRYFDVNTTYGNVLLQKPLSAKNRAFTNIAYETNGWKFDYTLNYNGKKRLPFTGSNPVIYQLPNFSPSYFLMNAQVSKTLGKNNSIDIYVGAENLANYFQRSTIIAAGEPFSRYFDASLVWGPVTGRMFYAGLRFSLLPHKP